MEWGHIHPRHTTYVQPTCCSRRPKQLFVRSHPTLLVDLTHVDEQKSTEAHGMCGSCACRSPSFLSCWWATSSITGCTGRRERAAMMQVEVRGGTLYFLDDMRSFRSLLVVHICGFEKLVSVLSLFWCAAGTLVHDVGCFLVFLSRSCGSSAHRVPERVYT